MTTRHAPEGPGGLAPESGFSFLTVANRLPVDSVEHPDGTRTWEPAPGGLVAALEPVLAQHRGCWIGWPGVPSAPRAEAARVPARGEREPAPPASSQPFSPFRTERGITLWPVPLSQREHETFYEGFSNATLWPLYHNVIVPPVYRRDWWTAYREVNHRYAQTVAQLAAPGATVWVQDYQLQLVPGIVRQLRPDLTIGFFLHIPFPPADLFRQLPWREEVVRGMLGADLIGFHLVDSAENFLRLVEQVSGTAGSHTGQPDTLRVSGVPSVRAATAHIHAPDGRQVGVGAFPISIDTSAAVPASDAEVTALRRDMGDPELLLLGVDRLDYTKGILQRLLAYEELLASQALPPRTTLLQVATPSRERVEGYQRARSQVEEAVGRINGRFGTPGHPMIEYLHRSVPRSQLSVFYSAADIMLVTPFKDGMNLVAKEYVAAHPRGTGALVLSEFAGAAEELPQAHLCNPFDLDSLERAVHQAARELQHQPQAARERMLAMHHQVHEHPVTVWADAFLHCLTHREEER